MAEDVEKLVETKVAEAMAGIREEFAASLEKSVAQIREDVLGDATKLLETAGKLIGELTPQMDIHSRIQTLEDDLNKLGIKVRHNLG